MRFVSGMNRFDGSDGPLVAKLCALQLASISLRRSFSSNADHMAMCSKGGIYMIHVADLPK
jgi:hypothetical protein